MKEVVYCCSCGKRIQNIYENETGAADYREAYICDDCNWDEYCQKSKSFCSYCGEVIPDSIPLDQSEHDCNRSEH